MKGKYAVLTSAHGSNFRFTPKDKNKVEVKSLEEAREEALRFEMDWECYGGVSMVVHYELFKSIDDWDECYPFVRNIIINQYKETISELGYSLKNKWKKRMSF